MMKKLILILAISLCISFCASANEINWFDIEPGYSVESAHKDVLRLKKYVGDSVFPDRALCTPTGKLITGFNYFFLTPVGPGLYQGDYMKFPDGSWQPVSQLINSEGEIIDSKLWTESKNKDDQLYSFFRTNKNPRVLSDEIEYDETKLLGPFTMYYNSDPAYEAMSDYEGNLLVNSDYYMIESFKPANPGKIYMHGEDETFIAEPASGRYFHIIGYLLDERGSIGIASQENGKFTLVDLIKMEVIEKDFDEVIGASHTSIALTRNGRNYVYGIDGKLRYEGDNRQIANYEFGKYIIYGENDKKGLTDSEFNIIYPCEYDTIDILADGTYILEKDSVYSFVSHGETLYSNCVNIEREYGYVNIYRDIPTGIYEEDFAGGSYELTRSEHFITDYEGNLLASNEDNTYRFYITKYGVVAEDFELEKAGYIINKNPLIEIDGETLCSDTMSRIKNNITLVPLRALAEKTGFEVSYNTDKKEISLTKGESKIEFTVGKAEAFANGKKISLEAAPEIINNRTLVPVRAISDAFGYGISWDGERRLVEVNTTGNAN